MAIDTFMEFVAFLQATKSITRYKIHVRRIKGMVDNGTTSPPTQRGVITICVNADMDFERQIDTLIHEWGHAYEYQKHGYHGKTWGIGNAIATTAWEEYDKQRWS